MMTSVAAGVLGSVRVNPTGRVHRKGLALDERHFAQPVC